MGVGIVGEWKSREVEEWEVHFAHLHRCLVFQVFIVRKLVTFTIILISLLSLSRFYTRFKAYAAPIPPGVYLAGLDLSTLKDPTEIRTHLEHIYKEPIAVHFADERLLLRPEEVDFHLDVDAMVAEASQYLYGSDFVEIAAREALGIPQRRRDIQMRFSVNEEKIRTWLAKTALAQNRPPQIARVVPPSTKWSAPSDMLPELPANFVGSVTRDWQWIPGAPGYTLDIEASIPAVIDGLTRTDTRAAELVVQESAPALPTTRDLEKALDGYLSDFPGFAAVYVYDITRGEAANVDADVSFSGMSTLKIAIVAAVMQRMNGLPAGDTSAFEIGQWIDFALGESNNFAANLLVQWLGSGNIGAGAASVTQFVRGLGFENTFMQSGYDASAQLAQIPTPGNQRDDWNTNPDSNLQSTPAEMARILTGIYECTQGKGLLLEAYPDDFTPEECEYMLFYLSHDHFQELLWAGVPRPQNTWFLHKHGFAYESHSDVALVWGPAGPYVISLFLYRSGWMDWNTSNQTMQNVSRITWNFFELLAHEGGIEPGEPPALTPPPAYVPVPNFVPAPVTNQ